MMQRDSFCQLTNTKHHIPFLSLSLRLLLSQIQSHPDSISPRPCDTYKSLNHQHAHIKNINKKTKKYKTLKLNNNKNENISKTEETKLDIFDPPSNPHRPPPPQGLVWGGEKIVRWGGR
jgi:hypothetical protein